MRNQRGFTLIELLIVVAIIAILAAIAVPNFLEAQVRSKVSRARSDMRSLATGLESYYIDNNIYPAMTLTRAQSADEGLYLTSPPTTVGRTFRLRQLPNSNINTLTTPVAYITSYFADPFASVRGTTFRYFTDGSGWILGSWGPDTDQATDGDLGWSQGNLAVPLVGRDGVVETVYDSRIAQPSILLLTGEWTGAGRGAYTYDPTNGSVSEGDVWRVKQ
jgi:prepilin-type N-terminal cleavage/methylation domain-containing protein